jgi:putative hydrolase of the HAD superfamily
VLRDCGSDPDPRQVAELVAADRELQRQLVVLYDDVVPFLESLRAAGMPTAFVSNCAENTRPLLDSLGLSDLVDHLVLSCEVGAAKPEPAIYQLALDRLGVDPGQAVFVDDQASYCEGATALGITAVRIDRHGGSGQVSTLTDLLSESWISLP